GIDIVPRDSPAAALSDADIIITITTSPEPVFAGVDLPDKPLHINAMGAHYPWVREIDEYTVANSRVFVDEMRQGWNEEGEIIMPLEAGAIDRNHVIGDLGALAAGKLDGCLAEWRVDTATSTRWTLFLSGGTGIEDVAVARRLYEKAVARGIGTEIQFNQPYEYEL
ncbi:MAG: hypothetical protein F4X87_01465, partial [Chloroflexi bacterium]|nr:hypothetical protein [Chloroflexota bacterium]